jgi:hypothetical protein
MSLWRTWIYGYNTLEKGNANIKKSKAEQMKLWRKHSLGVLALKKAIILSILIRRFSVFLQGRNERFL